MFPELIAGSGVRTISVSGDTPEQARAVLQVLLESQFAASVPRGTSREFLLERIKNQAAALTNLRTVARSLQENAKTVEGASEGEQYSRALAALVSDIATKEIDLWQLHNSLRGMQPGDVIVQPTTATIPNPRRLLEKLIVVATLALALTLALVTLRRQWRRHSSSGHAKLSIA